MRPSCNKYDGHVTDSVNNFKRPFNFQACRVHHPPTFLSTLHIFGLYSLNFSVAEHIRVVKLGSTVTYFPDGATTTVSN